MWVILFFFLAFVLLLVKELEKRSKLKGPWPFYAKKPLTEVEQVLYHRLVRALPDHIVLAQVQLSRVLGVKRGHNFHTWNNRIDRMSLDFIVCRKDSSVMAVIELDDRTHERESRQEADAKKNRALSSAGVSLIRWRVNQMPGEREIRKHFLGREPRSKEWSLVEVATTGKSEFTF